ncbi:MAG: hypothetical protein HY553_07750 [Elusimicrobia bacterium]|nr:hypothetical protein [Elusimicrobiota bacterium]
MDTRRRSTPWAAGFTAAVVALAASAPLFAEDRPNTGDPKTPGTQMRQGGRLNVNDTDIKSLRERGYSWGDVGRALVIADQSGRSLNEVTGLRDSGLSWDDIGTRFNVTGLGGEQGKKGKKRRGDKATQEPGMREAPAGAPGDFQPQPPGTSPTTEPGTMTPSIPPQPAPGEVPNQGGGVPPAP